MDRLEHGYPSLVEVDGDTAYFITSDDFMVIDASDPGNLSTVGSLPYHTSEDLAVSGDVGISPSGSVANIFDLSIPSAPVVVGICNSAIGSAGHVEMVQGYAYVTFGSPGFYRVVTCDVSNPASPVVTSEIYIAEFSTDLLVVRGHLIEATTSGIRTLDLTDPSTPVWDGWLSLAGDPDRMGALSNLLFITDTNGEGSLMVIDITDLSNPSLACSIPTAEKPTTISVSGGLIYVGLENTGFQVFGIPGLVFADDFESGYHHHWASASP
jgi:hypothetical protein